MSQSDDTAETTDCEVRLAYLLADVGRWSELDDARRSRVAAAYLETHPDLVALLLSVGHPDHLHHAEPLGAAQAELLGRPLEWDDTEADDLADLLGKLAWSHA
jgi:glyoxylase-like metal-dependent hydrolase (beta-lactamase superfamily II)